MLHDATEAYMVDLPRPIKHSLGFEEYRRAEAALEVVVARRFCLPPEMPAAVKEADTRILLDEKAALMGPAPMDWALKVEPLGIQIQAWAPARAETEWLSRFHRLTTSGE